MKRCAGGPGLIFLSVIETALAALARLGYYVEPTSAAAAAGLSQLIARGVIAREAAVSLRVSVQY